MRKIKVAILGATGAVGQRFIQLLENHPWFEIHELIGSDRSAGRTYAEAARWVLDGSPPPSVHDKTVLPLDAEFDSPLVFSALPKEPAVEREPALAAAGHIVCTNASAHRMAADVPLLLPEINADHIGLIEVQRRKRGWNTGALIANSNCTVMPVVMSLAPLRVFGIERVHVVSMQAISGAGYPGVPSLDILDNVIPYIGGSEEEKIQEEAHKMLGSLEGDVVVDLPAAVGAACNRVPVVDGHLVSVSVGLRERVSMDEIITAWNDFRGSPDVVNLPSAPKQPLYYLHEHDRPQPRRDRMAGNGMSTSIGRLRPCPILDYKYSALSHNTIRGAAGCSILNAELLAAKGYFDAFEAPIAHEASISAGD
ncbi:MAG: aspartate-semialdehyde dehydrogenase [Anaerolineae bacterium]|nr:aspartate-semialdehyde dehydrogenase [Anaerolineae bacterium]